MCSVMSERLRVTNSGHGSVNPHFALGKPEEVLQCQKGINAQPVSVLYFLSEFGTTCHLNGICGCGPQIFCSGLLESALVAVWPSRALCHFLFCFQGHPGNVFATTCGQATALQHQSPTYSFRLEPHYLSIFLA